jgi:exodeoxyribonuclease-5
VTVVLTPDQERAFAEIQAAGGEGVFHLLTGYAGSGKTTLVQHCADAWQHMDVVLTAPTHKAVAVLARKLASTGVDLPCVTIHSLLSLIPRPHGDRMVFERKRRAKPVTADIVVIDEASMLGADLMRHIRRHLPMAFVLFVGDPAQLPPVGEVESEAFAIKSRSHLDTIIRQSADNPILDAAHAVRASQGGPADWSWMSQVRAAPLGVYMPADAATWMRAGFCSERFRDDPDSFRYLAWTNARVASVNRQVRRWIYGGDTPTPFMPGERAIARSPVFMADGQTLLISTNEEATVEKIGPGTFAYALQERGPARAWTAMVPSWRVDLLKDGGERVTIDIPRDERAYQKELARIADEAGDHRDRWGDFHAVKQRMGSLQAPYAMTVHTSQGSTFRNVFVDIADIRKRVDNVLEMQQLLYVAVTRPSHALVLVNAA